MSVLTTDHQPAPTLCNFTVAATAQCPTIISAAHALYYWRHKDGVTGFELENARDAMRKLNEAFAAVEAMFAPGEAVQREVDLIKVDMAERKPAPASHVDAFAAEHQADYDDERQNGWCVP